MSMSSAVRRELGHYVYAYVDPRDESIFYVGKGVGDRCEARLQDPPESNVALRIAEIVADGEMPRIDILTHNLPDSETALRVEAAVIDAVGRKNLANQIGGWNSVSYGRMTLERIKVLYDAQPIDFAEIREPVLLIRINQLFRYDMTPLELYEATRGVWNLNLERASTVRLVFAVYEGIVQEAYRAAAWFPGGTTAYFKRPKENVDAAERCEFVGNIAEPEIRDKYVGRQVGPLFVAGARSPVKYVEPSVG